MSEISVIVPVFNVSNYILDTLETIINQDFKDFEVIVVDDGSTDCTLRIINDFIDRNQKANSRIKLIKQSHSGVSNARNNGMDNAEGKFIIFFDSDDLMKDSLLSKLYEKTITTGCDISICGYDLIDENGTLIRKYTQLYNYFEEVISGEEALLRILKKEISVWTGSQLFRKDFLTENKIRYTPGATHGEDQEFSFKALYKAPRVACVPLSLANYVQRQGSTIRKKTMKHFHYIGSMKRTLCFLKKNNCSSEIITLFEHYKIPSSYITCIKTLIKTGFPAKFVLKKIVRNKYIIRELSSYKGIEKTNKVKIKAFLIRNFPSLYFILYLIEVFIRS